MTKKIKNLIIGIFLLSFVGLCIGCTTSVPKNTYEIIYVVDGKTYQKLTIDKGDKAPHVTAPTLEGKVFEYWSYQAVEYDFNTVVTNDLVLVAKYKTVGASDDVYYKVEWIINGEAYFTEYVLKGTVLDEVIAPSYDNMRYSHWEKDGEVFDFDTPIDSDIKLYAIYVEVISHTVTYILDGEIFDEKTVEEGHYAEEIGTLNVSNKLLKYWSYDGKEFDFTTPITKDITLTAVYEEVTTHNVTYMIEDEEYLCDVVVSGECTIEQTPLEISGKEFKYWSYEGEEFDFSTPITKDITLIAVYENMIIVIEYWHANGGVQLSVLQDIKESFEEQYPEYEVELSGFSSYDELRDTVVASIISGVQPTAAQTYPDHVSLYLEGKALQSLDEYINDPVYGMSATEQAQFLEGFWNEGTIYDAAGTRYAMPFNKSTELMYYNSDMFKKYGWEVPTTWEEVVKIAEAWKKTDEYKAAVKAYPGQVYPMGYDSEANLFITLTQQAGAVYTSLDAQGKGVYNAFGAVEEDTLKSKAALQFVLDEFNNQNFATSTAFGVDYCSDAFKNGQCIMLIGSSAGSNYNDGQKSNGTKFTTGVSAVPQMDKENGQVIQQGTNVSLFKCSSHEEELGGWLWLKHMVSYESALLWTLGTSYFPIRKDVLNSSEYQNYILNGMKSENSSLALAAKVKQIAFTQQDWFFVNYAFAGSTYARDMGTLIVQQILYAQKSIDQAYLDAYDRLKIIYN